MELTYTLQESDFLIYHLFAASKSAQVKRKRQRTRWIIPIIYAVIAIAFFFSGKPGMAVIFVVTGILWMAIYPFYSSWLYRRQYLKMIRESYSRRFDKEFSLAWDEEHFILKDESSDSRIEKSELEEISEIASHYFLRLKKGISIIIPKRDLSDPVVFGEALEQLRAETNVEHNSELTWKWK